MIELRPEQRELVNKAKIILLRNRVVYIAGEVRVGKTPSGIITAKECGWKNVCVVTSKNAISGIEKFTHLEPSMRFKVTNFEQVGKLMNTYDGFIVDEAHKCGQFGKPSLRTKKLKELIGDSPVILMSGTPHPETPSQIYHQFWLTGKGPFTRYSNFYKWAKDFVNVKKKFISGYQINDYSDAKAEAVQAAIAPYMVTLSQEEAGFTAHVEEEILKVSIDERIYQLMDVLKKKKVYQMKSGDYIVCDTPVKMQSVFHQLCSGTIKIDEKRITLDESKAWFIKTKFAGQKIAIYYQFIAEFELLQKVFPNWTDNPDLFNQREDLVFMKQFVSGREGINISTADALIAYNIAFSATTYWQFRARLQEKNRTKAAKMYWIFSERGIEHFVYKAVVKKQNYTKRFFMTDLKLIGSQQYEFQ